MAILRRINLNALASPALTNPVVIVPLSGSTFDFTGVNPDGRNLDVLDSDGTTSLAHQLRDWGTGLGLRLIETRPCPTGSDPKPYVFSTAIWTGNLGLANDPHTLRGIGSAIDSPPPTYGQLLCYDKNGAVTWTHQSPGHDYVMSCHMGDVNGDGVNEVAVAYRLVDSIGQVLSNTGSLLWTYNNQTTGGGTKCYVRIAKIGKMRTDLTGNEVLWGGSSGTLALCDHNGAVLWSHGDGGTLPRFNSNTANATNQAAIIDDLTGSGTNAIYFVQTDIVRKIDNAGAVVWTHTHGGPDTTNSQPTQYAIAAGYITSLTSKQLVISSAGSLLNLGHVYVLDSTGALVWERCIPAPSWSVSLGDVNGDGYDEILVTWGTQTAYTVGDGWGGVIILDRNGNELTATSTGSSMKFIQWFDTDGDGIKEIAASCDDGNLYRWVVEPSGASVKATVPSITAGTSKTIYLASSANPTLIPALGAFDFNLAGANGSAPPGMTQFLGTWTIQAGTIQSPSDGNTQTSTAIEATGISTDAFTFEFTAVKNNQADGSSAYYIGCRYRCTNWISGLPKGFLFQLNNIGTTLQCIETAAGTTTSVQGLYSTPSSGITFNTTDVMRFRIVVSGLDHSASYSKNGSPWRLIYHVKDGSGTPNTGAGTVALYSGRGQTQFSALALHTIPSALGTAGPGPAPIITVASVVAPVQESSAHILLESGSRALLESGSGLMTEGIAVSTTNFLSLENGFDLLLEDGTHLCLESFTAVVIPPVPSLQLREAVYSRLSTSSAITALIGSRIHFGALPQTINLKDGPALSYMVISRPYGHVLTGADGTSQARVQLTAHGYRQAGVDQIIQAVRDSFDGFVGSIGGLAITACILDNEIDLPSPPFAGTDQWTYSIAADYQINHRVSLPASLT